MKKKHLSLAMAFLLATVTLFGGLFVANRSASAATLSFGAAEDFYMDGGVKQEDGLLKVRQLKASGGSEVDSNTIVSYLRFNVTGVTGTVTAANLKLFVENSGDPAFRVYGATGSSLNPLPTGTLLYSETSPYPTYGYHTWATFDLSSLITGNGSYVVVIKGTNGVSDVHFHSSDSTTSTWRPTLEVTTSGTDTTPPGTVTGLSAGATTSSAVALSWTAPSDNIGVTGYEVVYRTDSTTITSGNWGSATLASPQPTGTPKPAGQTESFTVSNLSSNTTYRFSVRAKDAAGNLSTTAATNVTATTTGTNTAPSQITGFTKGAVTDTTVAFTWTAPTNPGLPTDHYEIRYRTDGNSVTDGNWGSSTAVSPQPSGTPTSFTVSNLTANTTYKFAIRAYDSDGLYSPASANQTATTTNTTGNAITDLHDVRPETKSFYVTLAWTKPANVASYDLRYSKSAINASNWDSATKVPFVDVQTGTTQTKAVSGLDPSTTYHFAIKWTNTSGVVSSLSSDYTASTNARTCTTTWTISTGTLDATDLPGGSVICLQPGDWQFVAIKNINAKSTASPDAPIQIINDGGLVNIVTTSQTAAFGVKIENSKYFQLTGSGGGTSLKYGIKVRNDNSVAVQVKSMSTDYEVDHIYAWNTNPNPSPNVKTGSQGFMLKNDPQCNVSDWASGFVQRNTSVHDNQANGVGGEGFYIGSSFYTNGETGSCNGQSYIMPNPIEGLRVYNNITENTGWDGIQVGSATQDVEIYDNQIHNFATKNVDGQKQGIQINSGTTGLIYRNYIDTGTGNAIQMKGRGHNYVFNNVMVNPGEWGVYVMGQTPENNPTDPVYDYGPMYFINNTIISPNTGGFFLQKTAKTQGNAAYNNIIQLDSGTRYFDHDLDATVTLTDDHNLKVNSPSAVHFTNGYHLSSTWTGAGGAIDTGLNVSAYGVTSDYEGIPRPFGSGYDMGAYEYHTP
ncbi:MAG: fibronectin type III domain-containing protein [Paenibacillaceae bacterium]|nr:fibronectin type III domain-containing protein [Paenibacillaceae bacterium]